MIPLALLSLLPYSSEPGLTMYLVFPDRHKPVVNVMVDGMSQTGAPVIQCGYGTFWPEVVDMNGRRIELTPEGKAAFEHQFKFRGTRRDHSFNVLRLRSKNNSRLFGEYPLTEIYYLKAGVAYRVRGIYDDIADTRRVTMRTPFVTFSFGAP